MEMGKSESSIKEGEISVVLNGWHGSRRFRVTDDWFMGRVVVEENLAEGYVVFRKPRLDDIKTASVCREVGGGAYIFSWVIDLDVGRYEMEVDEDSRVIYYDEVIDNGVKEVL